MLREGDRVWLTEEEIQAGDTATRRFAAIVTGLGLVTALLASILVLLAADLGWPPGRPIQNPDGLAGLLLHSAIWSTCIFVLPSWLVARFSQRRQHELLSGKTEFLLRHRLSRPPPRVVAQWPGLKWPADARYYSMVPPGSWKIWTWRYVSVSALLALAVFGALYASVRSSDIWEIELWVGPIFIITTALVTAPILAWTFFRAEGSDRHFLVVFRDGVFFGGIYVPWRCIEIHGTQPWTIDAPGRPVRWPFALFWNYVIWREYTPKARVRFEDEDGTLISLGIPAYFTNQGESSIWGMRWSWEQWEKENRRRNG